MSIASSRTARLRALLGESQKQFALRLGVSQPTVFRLEQGQAESGPLRHLLDQIERDLSSRPDPSGPPGGASAPPFSSPGADGAACAATVTVLIPERLD